MAAAFAAAVGGCSGGFDTDNTPRLKLGDVFATPDWAKASDTKSKKFGDDAPVPGANDARLLEWELIVPDAAGAERAARRLETVGTAVTRAPEGIRAADPWGTTLLLRT